MITKYDNNFDVKIIIEQVVIFAQNKSFKIASLLLNIKSCNFFASHKESFAYLKNIRKQSLLDFLVPYSIIKGGASSQRSHPKIELPKKLGNLGFQRKLHQRACHLSNCGTMYTYSWTRFLWEIFRSTFALPL